ncbi:MAG: hypothetical protein M3016_02565 [Actinomycetota bacterium]|nr:hypothetical protein [Actinomycetota bacterium]
MSAPPSRKLYLNAGTEPVFAVHHPAAPHAGGARGAVICPPFGWDDVSAYRSLRAWAQQLADSGFDVLRISFPGTGDSGGSPQDPDRLEAWSRAVEQSASHLVHGVEVQRVAVLGLGLGGLMACHALRRGAAIDDLVLWGVPATGRSMLRQLRAFSRLEQSTFYEGLSPPPVPPTPATGALEAGGFLLSAQTVTDLEGLDLTDPPPPPAAGVRVLLLDRDGMAADESLRSGLERAGAAVTVAAGPGYGALTSHPQRSRTPTEVIERVTVWLEQAPTTTDGRLGAPSPTLTPVASDTALLTTTTGAALRETPVELTMSFGRLDGILTEPMSDARSDLCAVLLNAGAVRRIGPSRMWVEAARRWGALGVPTLRLDVEGIGEADGGQRPYAEDGSLYVPQLVPQVLAALDALQERGLGDRFILAGLCAGAYWSFNAALADDRIAAAMLINPRALVWDPELLPARDIHTLLRGKPSWTRVRRGASMDRARALARFALASTGRWFLRRRPSQDLLTATLDVLVERWLVSGKRLLLLFSADEPLASELARTERLSRLQASAQTITAYVAVRDHTLRPSWAQQQVHAALDSVLMLELEQAPVPATN